MATNIIVIVGITGNQGASVADAFINEPGWKIRGISRDPSKPSGKAWSDKGVEMVAADLNDLDSLKKAFAGATAIFGVTDFWSGMTNPATHERAAKEGRTANEICYDTEVQHGKNVVDAAAATADTLERFVLSTLSAAKKWSDGKITWNLHFDAKWVAVEYLKKTYPELYRKASVLQVGLFMSNWKEGPFMAPNKQPDGTYLLRLPMSGDAPIPMADPRADTGHFVKALVDVDAGKNLLGCGSVLSWNEWCELWGKTHGKTCKFEQSPREDLEATLPGGLGFELADMFQYIAEYGYDGHDPSVVLPKDLGVDVPVTTIEEYMKKEDFSSIL